MATDEINFEEEATSSEEEMTAESFIGQSKFIRVEGIANPLSFIVEKVINNKNTTGTNKETGAKFDIGIKDKNGKVRRIDIHTQDGFIYTINSWEVYFKLFGKGVGLMQYSAKNNGSFKGAKVTITRNIAGQHANMNINDLAKIIDKPIEEARVYQQEVKKAMKEKRLYTVEVK